MAISGVLDFAHKEFNTRTLGGSRVNELRQGRPRVYEFFRFASRNVNRNRVALFASSGMIAVRSSDTCVRTQHFQALLIDT